MKNNKKEIVVIVPGETMREIEFDIKGNKDDGFVIKFLNFEIKIEKELSLLSHQKDAEFISSPFNPFKNGGKKNGKN